MLRRDLRLRKNEDFRKVYGAGKSFANRMAALYILPGTQGVRFGFVASKKIGNSVIRNRARRLLREAVRLNLSQFPSIGHFVVVARASIKKASMSEAERAILDLARRARALVKAEEQRR